MTFNDSDVKAMRLAIEASAEALADGDMPFGATLVSAQGEILLVAANNQNSAADCTGHAEMVLVRTAQKQLGLSALRGRTGQHQPGNDGRRTADGRRSLCGAGAVCAGLTLAIFP